LANKVGKKESDKVNPKIPEQLWLNNEDVFAGIVQTGSVSPIMDTEDDDDSNFIKSNLSFAGFRAHVDIERTIRSIRTEKNDLSDTVELMADEYRNDRELTAFTQLDMENFCK
jgi:hypothetical protein